MKLAVSTRYTLVKRLLHDTHLEPSGGYPANASWRSGQILGEPMEASSVRWISYWYSMWSHRRDGLWKGFVQVDLDSAQDPAALQLLTQAQADLGVVP